MDTKLTKFKYSITAKILCVTLSAIMFFSFVYSAVIIFAQILKTPFVYFAVV